MGDPEVVPLAVALPAVAQENLLAALGRRRSGVQYMISALANVTQSLGSQAAESLEFGFVFQP